MSHTTLAFLALLGAPYIYEISSLRVNHIVRMLGLHTLIYSSADSNIMTLHADFVVLSNLSGESGTGAGFVGSTSVVHLPLSLL